MCLRAFRNHCRILRSKNTISQLRAHSAMTFVQLPLTPAEKLFRQCLLDCRKHMQDVPGMEDLGRRGTGGWVRDKLLGVQSHDIDVALSSMTGMQYGQAMQAF